ncbi:bifunctional adenosylcobinamide kinase/adenosylcobinamide-phosphate guanylyltransferase [bacterium]|nr:bifunctional adenosylcobinamide kinase/adenosylcobinamide-phosphate guanylyltransferase [bacterium]
MARVILVTGGSRSGKSAYARALAESLSARRAFVATAPITDDEMRQRILRHQRERSDADWRTLEAPVDLVGALEQARAFDVVLVDCLTLWVNNLMYEAGRNVEEDEIAEAVGRVLAACAAHAGTVVFVTNEVGMSIVPENALARRYRDLVGRCNQTLAAGADAVTLVACGIPLHLKEG